MNAATDIAQVVKSTFYVLEWLHLGREAFGREGRCGAVGVISLVTSSGRMSQVESPSPVTKPGRVRPASHEACLLALAHLISSRLESAHPP